MLLSARPAHAHTIVELYNPLYLVGSALVVILSFVLMSLCLRSGFAGRLTARHDLLRHRRLAAALTSRTLRTLLAAGSVGALLMIVMAGLLGPPIEGWNLGPVLFWVLVWTVLPGLQVLVGNVWPVLNPWRVLFEWGSRARGRPGRPRWPFPARLGRWPAVALWLALTWFAAVCPDRGDPALLAWIVIGYSLLTWSGMRLFGPGAWLANVECLSVVLGCLARAGVVESRTLDRGPCERRDRRRRLHTEACLDCAGRVTQGVRRELNLRPPAAGLLAWRPASLDHACLVLMVLAGGMFGGLVETQPWSSMWLHLGVNLALSPWQAWWNTAGLAVVAFMSVALYAGSCWLITAATGGARRPTEVALEFAPSLVPVSALFHVAHNFDHAIEGAQHLARLVSDPFGLGWDLLGSRMWPRAEPDVFLIWHLQVALVVLAHVLAVYIAHARALDLYADRHRAIRSQLPLLALMILYTVSGLWILSTIPVVA